MDTEVQKDLASAYLDLGGTSLKLGEKNAGTYYLKNLEIIEKLSMGKLANIQDQQNLVTAQESWAKVALELGDTKAAKVGWEKALQGRRRLAKIRPADPETTKNVAVACEWLTDVCLHTGDVLLAEQYGRECVQLYDEFVKADPQDAKRTRWAAFGYQNMGYACFRAGDVTRAQQCYAQLLELRTQLWARDEPTDLFSWLSILPRQLGDGKTALALRKRTLRFEDGSHSPILPKRTVTWLQQSTNSATPTWSWATRQRPGNNTRKPVTSCDNCR